MRNKKNEIRFTLAKIRDLTPDEGKSRTFYSDIGCPGLRLSITPTGTKSFQYRGWSKELQKTVTVTLGKFPAMSLDLARAEVKKKVADVIEGKDLESIRQEEKAEITCKEMFDAWYEDYGKELRSGDDTYNVLKRYALKPFGSKKITHVTQADVQRWYNRLRKQKKANGEPLSSGTANGALRCLRLAFNKYIPKKHPNPCEDIERAADKAGELHLDGTELQRFLEAIDHERATFGDTGPDFYLLALYTGARTANIQGMKWQQLKEHIWEIPSADSKNKKPLGVALNSEAIEILHRRREQQKQDGIVTPFVFPCDRHHKTKTGHIGRPRKSWVRIMEHAKLPHSQGTEGFRPHDLRHTFGSQLALAGCSLPEIQQALGHRDSQTTQRYMHLSPDKSVVEMAAARMKEQVEKASKKISARGGE